MLSSFATDTVTRLRAPLITDGYGTPGTERDWANAVATVFTNCSVQYDGAQPLDQNGRTAVITNCVLRVPEDADMLATDRWQWAGNLYEVTGEVQAWTSPSGALNHKQAPMRRVRG